MEYKCPVCGAGETEANAQYEKTLKKIEEAYNAGILMISNHADPGGRELRFKTKDNKIHELRLSDFCRKCDGEKAVEFLNALMV